MQYISVTQRKQRCKEQHLYLPIIAFYVYVDCMRTWGVRAIYIFELNVYWLTSRNVNVKSQVSSLVF